MAVQINIGSATLPDSGVSLPSFSTLSNVDLEVGTPNTFDFAEFVSGLVDSWALNGNYDPAVHSIDQNGLYSYSGAASITIANVSVTATNAAGSTVSNAFDLAFAGSVPIQINLPAASAVDTQGDVSFDYSAEIDAAIPAGEEDLLGTWSPALPTGWTWDRATRVLSFSDATGGELVAGNYVYTFDTQVINTAEADWQSRISGPDVVAYQDFRSDAEVDAFRWTGGYGSGNDPLAQGNDATRLSRNTSDGVTGGGCLEYLYPAGSSPNSSYWWWPFSPKDTGNGKAAADPAANGAITVESWAPTDGGNQLSTWNDGYWAHPSENSTADGSEIFLQLRVKMDPRRITGGNDSNTVGKFVWLTTTQFSLSDGEHVVWSYGNGGNDGNDKNYLRTYVGGVNGLGYFDPLDQEEAGSRIQPGSDSATDWSYSGGWDTLLINLRPGTEGTTSGANSTRLRIYAAKAGETSYTKIWEQEYGVNAWESGGGLNALILGGFNNNNDFSQEFYHRFDQVILSRSTIPCPQV